MIKIFDNHYYFDTDELQSFGDTYCKVGFRFIDRPNGIDIEGNSFDVRAITTRYSKISEEFVNLVKWNFVYLYKVLLTIGIDREKCTPEQLEKLKLSHERYEEIDVTVFPHDIFVRILFHVKEK